MDKKILHKFQIHHLSNENIVRHALIRMQASRTAFAQFDFRTASQKLDDAYEILSDLQKDLIVEEESRRQHAKEMGHE